MTNCELNTNISSSKYQNLDKFGQKTQILTLKSKLGRLKTKILTNCEPKTKILTYFDLALKSWQIVILKIKILTSKNQNFDQFYALIGKILYNDVTEESEELKSS